MGYTFLDEMAVAAQVRVSFAKEKLTPIQMEEQARSAAPARSFDVAGRFVIAELLRDAPQIEDAPTASSLEQRLALTTEAGVNAVAIQTEPSHFRGSMNDLLSARFSVNAPLIRSDFIVDIYQIFESRSAGADGVVLKVPLLNDETLKQMIETLHSLGMFAIIDAWGENDILRAVHLGAEMISVTARSPDDHSLHPERLKELRPFIPADMTAIAQGGLSSVDDVKRAFELGYHGVLLGSGLLRADDPQQLLSDIIALTDE